jgi:hypothetical protein
MAKSRKSNRFDGCTFTFFVGMVTVALFVANGILIRAFFSSIDFGDCLKSESERPEP